MSSFDTLYAKTVFDLQKKLLGISIWVLLEY